MVNEIKRGRSYRVISENSSYFNLGDIVVSLEDNCSVPYCVPEVIYVEENGLDNYSTCEFHAIANYKLEEIEQEEQPSSTEKKITISKDDFKQALMSAMSDESIKKLLSKESFLAIAFIVFGSQIEMNLFKKSRRANNERTNNV